MKASDVLTGFRRAVLLHVLRQGEHKALAVVKNIDFFPLPFSEIEHADQSHLHHHGTHRHKHNTEQPYLAERGFDVFK